MLINSQNPTVAALTLGMNKWFNPTFYNGCNHLFILELKLIHVSKLPSPVWWRTMCYRSVRAWPLFDVRPLRNKYCYILNMNPMSTCSEFLTIMHVCKSYISGNSIWKMGKFFSSPPECVIVIVMHRHWFPLPNRDECLHMKPRHTLLKYWVSSWIISHKCWLVSFMSSPITKLYLRWHLWQYHL